MAEQFTGNFTQQEALGEEEMAAALGVMRSGRLHRYNIAEGEIGEVAALEQEYAAWQGAAYCLACASGGAAMQMALRAVGVSVGDRVLTNAFTLSPVPGAIVAAGGVPVLVETTEALVPNLDHLERIAVESGAKVMLLSLMRGHLPDMDALMEITDRLGIAVIEDCAHSMGATWRGKRSGSFGVAGCFSTQTYKHLNSGEGGLLTSDDAEFMARATILSGSYMLFDRHVAGPSADAYSQARLDMPNCSSRMDNLRAAILRPQLRRLDANVARWAERYAAVEAELRDVAGLTVIERPTDEVFVGSSIQFLRPEGSAQDFLRACAARGVELKWFGASQAVGFTSSHHDWRSVPQQELPQTDAVLAGLFDMRLPLTFSVDDCRQIGRIIRDCALHG